MIENKYPCTGLVQTHGFGAFLEKELSSPRRNIQLFTEELKTELGVQHLSLVNSGSSSNLVAAIAVRELHPKRNKVLLSSFSFPTTISSFALLGFDVELVDVSKNSFNISPEALLEKMDEEVACVCITHFLGFPANLERIKKGCLQYDILLVQDACETMNLEIEETPIYNYGDIITHSFYHPHHLSSFGGGAVISTSKKVQKKIESIIHWGRTCSCHYDPKNCTAPDGLNHNFWYERLGINVEMSELNACFGRFQLTSWKAQEKARNDYYTTYFQKTTSIDNVQVFPNPYNISPFVFPILVAKEKKTIICEELLKQGVETRSIMGGAIFKHPAFQHLDTGTLNNATAISQSSFFVGIHQTLSKQQIEEASNIVKSILTQYS